MPRKLSTPPKSATPSAMAGAVVQRQQATMEGLHTEASMAYLQVSPDNPLAANAPDRSSMGADAFRHAYASARASQEYGEPVANFLGRGVEWLAAATRENSSDGLNAKDIGMDLHNNQVGREIARELGANASSQDLREAIERAAEGGRLVLSTDDPRAQQEYDKQPDMRALSALYDAGAHAKDAFARGIHAARDLLGEDGATTGQTLEAKANLTETKDNLLESLKVAFKEAAEKVPDARFFKFSEAQLEKGEAFAQTSEAAGALEGVVAARESWEMSAAEFDGRGTSRDDASRDGTSRSVLDDPSTQEKVADAQAEQEMELEANMDAGA